MSARSASISTPKADVGNTQGKSNNQGPSARSVSHGSNFFTREVGGSGGLGNAESHGNQPSSRVASANGEIDIVGALNSLDLDFELPKPTDSSTSGIHAATNASTPFQSQFYEQFQNQLYAYPQAGSLTPNAQSIGTFGSAYGNTPSGTWSNFVPASAPQLPLSQNVNADLMSVKPFELPEESQGQNKPGDNNGSSLNMPFSTPPPQLQLGGAPFGGTLESFRIGDPLRVGDQLDSFKAEGSSSESDADGSLAERVTSGQHSVSRSFSTSGTPGGTPGSIHEFQPFDQKAPYAETGMPHYSELPIVGSMMQQMQVPMAQLSGSWPHQQPLQHVQSQHQPHHSGYTRNSGERHQGFNGRFNSGNNRRNMYEGMNVHRKMSRRRGDDAAKYANAKLSDFSGEIYNLCKDQHGCRFLQRQLDLGGKENNGHGKEQSSVVATMIFNEIYLKIVDLMVDPFGNYLIQKLFEHVSTDQRVILVKNAAPEFMRIALDSHGTRALQKLVECISTEEESQLLIKSLSPHVVALSRDLNGNHVVQKCLQRLSAANNQFIFDTAAFHCNEIATHRHGCCVLQRCLDHGTMAQRAQLSLKVAQNATNLSFDPFGNYVVQYVLTRGDAKSIEIVLSHIRNNIVTLSLHKFGSNVIEKSLRISTLTDTLIEVLLANQARFADMLNDAYGNYVLQTSLDVASVGDLRKLSDVLQPLLPSIKNTPHGRRIMSKIQSIA